MPITKNGSDEVVYTDKSDKWDSNSTGVFGADDFAIADSQDPLKQLQFDCSGIAPNTSVVLAAPATDGTLALKGNAGTLQYSAPLTGASVAMTGDLLIVNPAGTIAELTITLPAASDGKELRLSFTQEVTALTVTPDGADTLNITPSAAAAGQVIRLVARSAVWYNA